ncbi:MAG: PAS domain S-box protein, partial [Burkholderiales bacterium]
MKVLYPLLRFPVRWVVPVLLMLLGVVAALAYYAFRSSVHLEQMWQAQERQLLARLGIEQTRLEVQGGAGNWTLVRRLVTGLALHDGLDHAYLVDAGGQVLASLSRVDTGRNWRELESPLAARLLGETAPGQSGIRIRSDREADRLMARVSLQGGRTLAVSVDLGRPKAVWLADARQESLTVGGVIFLLALLIAALLHALWFRRSTRLTEDLRSLAREGSDVITPLQGEDELAQIGRAVAEMVARRNAAQSEARHRLDMVNRSPVVVIEWRNDPGWPLVFVSEAVRKWGYAPEELLGGRLVYNDLIHPDDVARVNEEIAAHVAGGRNEYRQRYRLRRADGGWAHVIDDTTVSRDAGGQVTGFSGMLTDVTEMVRVEAELSRQADRMAGFYDLPFIGMSITSPLSRRWVQVNDRLCEILGYSREQLLGMTWTQITHPDDLQDNLTLYEELLANQRQHYGLIKRFIRGDGRTVHVEIDVRARRLPDGTVDEVYTTTQDITGRLQADAEMRSLGAMADNASEALLLTIDGRIEDCNLAGWQMFGYPDRVAFLGCGPADLSPP